VADLKKGDGAVASPRTSRKLFQFFSAETNEKRAYTTSDEPQKVILAYDRSSLRKSAPAFKILHPSLSSEKNFLRKTKKSYSNYT